MAQIGDLVPKAGIYTKQGVVVEKKDDGTVVVDTEPLEVSKYHRHTNTTGLSVNEKNMFNQILDKVYQRPEDVDKINEIQKEIDRMKVDPNNQNIVQYLRNQQSHLVRAAKKTPRTYNWDESQLRT